MYLLVTVVVFALTTSSVYSESCGTWCHHKSRCYPPECDGGKTVYNHENGTCRTCCAVCVKPRGEWCGGLNDEEGVCDTGLTCLKPWGKHYSVGQCLDMKCVGDCTREGCPEPLHCDGRKVSTVDEAGCYRCCPACVKQEGELCGGPKWVVGVCDRGLTCTAPPSHLFSAGKCVKGHDKDYCAGRYCDDKHCPRLNCDEDKVSYRHADGTCRCCPWCVPS